MSLEGPPYIPPTPWTVWAVEDERVHRAQNVTSSPERVHGVSPELTLHDRSMLICIFVSMHRLYSSV